MKRRSMRAGAGAAGSNATSASFAGKPFAHRALALVALCGTLLIAGNNNYGIAVVSAFSPSYLRAPTSFPNLSTRSVSQRTYAHQQRAARLSYKHRENDDSPEASFDNGKNETAIPNIQVDVDISVEISKDVIYYNDLDPVPVSSSTYDASFSSAEITEFGSDANAGSEEDGSESNNGLIHELEDAITAKNINIDTPSLKAIEPSTSKPSKKFVSPIQMIKKVPKVEPIHMSTVFFLKLIGDPMWTEGPTGGAPRGPAAEKKKSLDMEKKKPVIESWKTKMQRKKSTAFQATNYLEALSATSNTKNEDNTNDDTKENKDDMLRALRDQQAQNRRQQHEARRQAFIEANRRTNPKEAIQKRTEEAHNERKQKEREKLERLYVERKERLDAKERNEKMYLEERERQREILEGKKREREEAGVDAVAEITGGEDGMVDTDDVASKEEMPELMSTKGKRGIPVLDILSRPPVVDAPPLLVGSTLTFAYSDLTPFQKRAVEVARGYHEEHCQQMKLEEDGCDVSELLSKGGNDCSIQAAPIVAIIDSYTASAMEEDESLASPQQQRGTKKRFATLAAIEIVENDFDNEPSAVKFMGVSRAFLHGYFSSKDAGLTKEEEELNHLLARIQQFDREEELDEEDHETVTFTSEHEEEDDDQELPVVMAEFEIFLDDSSILSKEEATKYGEDVSKKRVSSMHAITELYRMANKVYRLHEERKKLVAGLRAGVARLRTGKKRISDMDENCLVEYEDCDGLGLIGGVVTGGASTNFVEEDVVASEDEDVPLRSRLEKMENYGFGSYGILSTIPDLTGQLISQLEPYYSPVHREREEYDAEVASMVVFQSLQEYATPDEVAHALLAPSATKRLELAYDIMMRHAEELNDLVKKVSEELMDCGEECTDLW